MLLNLSFPAFKIRQVFYSAVIVVLAAAACKKKEQIGLAIQDNQIGVAFTDTITLNTETVLYNDSIVTSDQPYSLAGAYVDPLFGEVAAITYTQLVQGLENKNVSGYTSLDSVVLNLNYAYHYGDTSGQQTLKVYELTSPLYKDSVYKSTETNKLPAYNSSVPLDKDIPFELRPVEQKLNKRIALDNSFGLRILNDIIGSGKSNADFLTSFKGIAIMPKHTSEGSVIALDLSTNGTRVTIYYKNSTGVRDSVMLLANSSYAHFHTISSDRTLSPEPIISLLVNNGNTQPSGGAIAVQGGIGIRTKVRIPSLSTFKSKVGNLAINRAELLIPYSDDDQSNPITSRPVPSLRLIKLNQDGSLMKIASGNSYDEVAIFIDNLVSATDRYSVPFNTTLNAYSFDISSYVHAVMQGVESNYGFVISTPMNANKVLVNRTFVPSGSIKLKIYYTKV